METIKICGARIHNLKKVNLTIPKHQLIAVTGISGSGKSSLAFDLLFEEGKNQYLSSIGILSGLNNEDRFDSIEGLGPTVAQRQNTVRQSNPRSTVGTKTTILNQLALIYASDGTLIQDDGGERLSPGDFLYTTADGMCVQCQGRGIYYDVNQEQLIPDHRTTLAQVYEKLRVTSGYLRILQKKYGEYFETPYWELPEEIRDEVVYGTYDNGKQSYCMERTLKNAYERGEDVEGIYEKMTCPKCHGERVSDAAKNVLLHGKRIGELGQMTLSCLLEFLEEIEVQELSTFGYNVVRSLKQRLRKLIDFHLGHLTLYREMSTLSGGEIQRIFLYQNLASGLDSVIYVFDEPMAGLHPSEKQSMIDAIKKLKELGNTVIVVEHDPEMIGQADQVIEFGPKAGRDGGTVVYHGSYEGYRKADTLLSKYISGKSHLPERTAISRTQPFDAKECLELTHANAHYLKDVSVKIPLHAMVGIAGLSGSGKSSLILDTLLKRLATARKHGRADGLSGEEQLNGFAVISQEPIGRSSSSTPASYIGIWDKIRELYAAQPEAIQRDLSAGYFSFHSKGACPDCGGSGYERIYLTSEFSVDKVCPMCHGERFQQESLEVTYRGKTIADILKMSISEAVTFFQDQNGIVKPLRILEQMGMGYLTLGQPTSLLSGGEAQRVKLAKELGKQRGSNLLYVLDEPSTGLSLYDTALLLKQLDQLVAGGNSVIVIEHNVEILKRCDYVIELGPEGGDLGGEIIAAGTPKQLFANSASKTGRYLA